MHCILYNYRNKCTLLAVSFLLMSFLYSFAYEQTSPSNGIKFALLGDSMTWIGGDSCEKPTGWSHLLKESGLAESIKIYARSGATWTNTVNTKRDSASYSEVLHDNNVIYNQMVRLIEDCYNNASQSPDYIIIFAGANDAWFANLRPGIYDPCEYETKFSDSTDPSTVTSLSGSVALVCDVIQQYFPSAFLTIVTPIQMSKVSSETIHKTSDIIEEVAHTKGISVIRADKEVGITHEKESKSPTYTYDGVHTNPDGARLVAEYIISNLPCSQSKKN